MNNVEFCTCKNYGCEFNPRNHDQGCNLCIQVCLKDSALPSCFFKAVAEDLKDVAIINDSSYQAFAKLILKDTE